MFPLKQMIIQKGCNIQTENELENKFSNWMIFLKRTQEQDNNIYFSFTPCVGVSLLFFSCSLE